MKTHHNELEWKINTPAFLKEVFENYPGGNSGIFTTPVRILQGLLIEVATRSSELNDPVLNALMCRLALYGESDPYDKENYNEKLTTKILNGKEYKEWSKKFKET